MSIRIVRQLSIGTLMLLTVLSGCNGNSGAGVPSPAKGGASLAGASPDNNGKGHGGGDCNASSGAKGGSLIYSAQLYGDDAKVYSRNGTGYTLTYDCTFTGGLVEPDGTVTTPNGWWYVANEGASNVLVYQTKHGTVKGPVSSLSDYGQLPVNVDANPSRKLVAVSNKSSTSGATGSVSVYLDRQAVPSRMLTYGTDILEGQGVAITHSGDCYWSFYDPTVGSGSIVEFSGCNGSGTVVVSSITAPAGIAFDHSDNLYYLDSSTGIYKCKKTSNCQPWATGFSKPVNMNFDQHYQTLWVADASGYIDAVSPKSGQIEYQYSTGASDPPFGIAPEPGS
jgi:DNA-binding beta-propeller fold protein YncE